MSFAGYHHTEEAKVRIAIANKSHDVSTCSCCCCRAKRGEYIGRNNPNYGNHKIAGENHYSYKDGRSLQRCYCIDCGKAIGWRSWWYGSQKCNSCVKKGEKHSSEHIEKILQSLQQYQFKEGHITNIGRTPWNKDKNYSWSEEVRASKKNSPYYFKSGSLHPNWRGGVSTTSELIRTSDEYNRWRKDIFKRDNYRCVVCSSNKSIEAHHLLSLSTLIQKYNIYSLEDAYKCQEIWDRNNGETRCHECHNLTKRGLLRN